MNISCSLICTIAAVAHMFVALCGHRAAAQDVGVQAKTNSEASLIELQILNRLDRNNDGQLSENEIPDEAKSFVSSTAKRLSEPTSEEALYPIDLKQLGELAKNMQAPQRRQLREPEPVTRESRHHHAAVLIYTLDKNRDGILKADEMSSFGKQWRAFDANSDGRLSVGEAKLLLELSLEKTTTSKSAFGDSAAATPEEFRKLDVNQDGQVQMAEFATKWNQERLTQFQRIDANGDGLIERNEWLNFLINKESKRTNEN